jgi:hypothetical protein
MTPAKSPPYATLYLLLASILFAQPAIIWANTEKPAQTQPADNGTDKHPAPVQLSQPKQALADLQTQPLIGSHYQPEFQASAQVVDLQPLLNLREQYFTAQTEVQGATTALALVQQVIKRTHELYRNGINSQRQLQEQQMAHSTAQARLNSSQYRLQSINDNLTANWGSTLSAWAKTSGNNEFASLINGQQALLLLSLPAGQTLPKETKQIAVDPTGDRQTPQPAQLISNAPQGSELSQGETYFFKTSRAKLRTGMRLSAWITKPGQALTGFVIPASALIWHAGLATIYIKIAPEQFQRLSFTHYYPVAQGYFVAATFPANAEIVTIGAQVLLSQEFRGLIPAEDDGDD